MVHAQVQTPGYQCSQCPQGQQMVPIQPQQQFIQPQQPLLAAAPPPSQPSITIENITQAITTALDPINKHLAVQDAEIANITTIITKLQTQPAPLPQPLPPPSTNSTSPPPPPPGEQQQGQPPQSGSACPNSGGGSGGPPINQYFYPGPGGFGPHFGGNFGGSHGGHHGGH